MAEKERREANIISKAYLVLYNVLQTMGWSYIFVLACQHFSHNGFKSKGLYSATEIPLKICQTAAILEVIHCMVGLVPSSTSITAMQVASRLIILWPVTHSVREVQDNMGVLLYLSAWTVTEIIRYSLYVFNILKYRPYLLQWCRYTFFIVLYPIGVTGEILTVFAALPYVKKGQIYSVSLPNALNISFSFYIILCCFIASYIPVFPMLYMHMVHQRKKVLGRESQMSMKKD